MEGSVRASDGFRRVEEVVEGESDPLCSLEPVLRQVSHESLLFRHLLQLWPLTLNPKPRS